jgi:uncharacterized membrane protein YdjX (TVP38/TMEM64 family)
MSDKGKTIFGVVFVVSLFVGAIFFAEYIQDKDHIKDFISSFGVFGILFVSFIGGLNLIVPLPPTVFIPIFSAAGFSLFVITSIIIIGTTIADLLSYYIGTVFKDSSKIKKNKAYKLIKKWCEGKPKVTQLAVFLWASFIPIPNEVLLLPLGVMGIKLKNLVTAFVLGTTIHVTVLAYGLTSFI